MKKFSEIKQELDSASDLSDVENIHRKKFKTSYDSNGKRVTGSYIDGSQTRNNNNMSHDKICKQEISQLKKKIQERDESLIVYKKEADRYKSETDRLKKLLKEKNDLLDKISAEREIIEFEKNQLEKEKAKLQGQLSKVTSSLEDLQVSNYRRQQSGLLNLKSNIDKTASTHSTILSPPEDILSETFEVGYLRKDTNEIHLGRNVWLPMQVFTHAISNVKSVSALTRNLAVAIFTEDVLSRSTVTGKSSNRSKKSSSLVDQNEIQQLDPVKVMALKDIVRWILVSQWKISTDIADEEADLVRSYISRKIADLKDEKKKSKKSS